MSAVRGDLLWEICFAVAWLAQSNGGKEDLCLFCVYGSSGIRALSVPSASPTVNADKAGVSHNFRKKITFHVFIFHIILSEITIQKQADIQCIAQKLLQYFCCPHESRDDLQVDETEGELIKQSKYSS